MSFREKALETLRLKAEADRAEAELSLSLLLDHPAGVGEHSETDFYENLHSSLGRLADAEDRLTTLSIYRSRSHESE